MKNIVNVVVLSLTILPVLPLGKASSASAETQQVAHLTSEFMERIPDKSWEIVDSRGYAAPVASPFYFSMGNFTCKLTMEIISDTIIRIESTLNSYDEIPRNYFDINIVAQGASIFFDSVLVREGSKYRVRITFDSLGTMNRDCGLLFGADAFTSDPSGDFDFFFIKQSLGDYRWNPIRDAFEYDYDRMINVYQITERDKIYFYISPCELGDIGWDIRWRNGYDFARKNVFAEFTHGVNELHPQVVYMVKFMRIWGYAPALLLEGVASTIEYVDYYAKEALRQGSLPDLTQFGKSSDFRKLDRELSSHAAGSFVFYLIKMHGQADLKRWYKQATDLTLAQSFSAVYGASMVSMQEEWKAYLDTVTISPGSLEFFVRRSQQFLHLGEMLTFAEAQLDVGGDSADVAQTLATLYFTFGDYQQSEQFVRQMVKSEGGEAKNEKVFLANMLLAQGEIGKAEEVYYDVSESDSMVYMSYFKLGQIESDRGNLRAAIELFHKARALTTVEPFVIDSDIWIGDVYAGLGQRDSSLYYYQDALNRAKVLAASFGENPLHHLAVGRAALRLNSLDLAEQHLSSALFLEERMFYLGQIFLATGMLYDAAGEREKAIREYRQVLEFPSAYLDRKQAERYIQTPYQF